MSDGQIESPVNIVQSVEPVERNQKSHVGEESAASHEGQLVNASGVDFGHQVEDAGTPAAVKLK